MSSATTPNESPFQPMHNPSMAAHVVVPQAPLGNVANQAPGMGAKALLAKKFAKSHNPTYVSPTDNLVTPCSQKLNAAKKKHFDKGAKPMAPLLSLQENSGPMDELAASRLPSSDAKGIDADDENPF